MEYKLKNIKPNIVFRYFEELSAIPRCSGNEAAAVDYIAAVAIKHGLWYHRDDYNNILVVRPADNGKESVQSVLLQGHTDMVCQKNSDISHDFDNVGIELIVKDGYISANGTTLGGDDGIACAYMLALLTSDDLNLGRIECLFTSNEEVGMTGAYNFDYSLISSGLMINLDSEDEGTLVAGCAGGVRCEISFDTEPLPEKNKIQKIEISGLCGGHSGSDINSGRKNAARILAQLLDRMYQLQPFNLVSLFGGDKDNAIPREAVAVIATPEPSVYSSVISDFIAGYKNRLVKDDNLMRIRTAKHRHIGTMFSFSDTSRIISELLLSANGVSEMSAGLPDMVETSSNLGIVRAENGSFRSVHLIRSNSDCGLELMIGKFKRFAKLLGCDVKFMNRYPGWEYKKTSRLRDLYSEIFEKLYERKPKVEAIHAGLECGVILSNLPDMDIISIGPDIEDIHSPDERLNIASAERTWNLLLEILKHV